eukprot:4266487-Lingulodinium_polyedra.AAC.2
MSHLRGVPRPSPRRTRNVLAPETAPAPRRQLHHKRPEGRRRTPGRRRDGPATRGARGGPPKRMPPQAARPKAWAREGEETQGRAPPE